MQFTVGEWRDRERTGPGVFLQVDNWDDYGYKTLFSMYYADGDDLQEIGPVKIGRTGMTPPHRVDLPVHFKELDSRYFSIGQDESYYENLRVLGTDLRQSILKALRDLAWDAQLFARLLPEHVVQQSLLRSVSASAVRNQYRRIAHGGKSLAPFGFQYQWPPPTDGNTTLDALTFHVEPHSQPPTNIHAVIGSNGVGKTRLLQNLARAVADSSAAPQQVGAVADDVPGETNPPAPPFANLVVVSFSAFDHFEPFTDTRQTDGAEGVKRTLVTLNYDIEDRFHADRSDADGSDDRPDRSMQYSRPAEIYAELIAKGFNTARHQRWKAAVQTLSADPLFADADVVEGSTSGPPGARELFDRLSSGHKIVLLTITHLAALVTERTLVLIDEPETHLHPPLLAALIRAISDLLVELNGVALIATHSPVVLQEIPSHCVYKLHRSGNTLVSERPTMETYGENVGVLTREVFKLEATQTGFHRELAAAVDQELTFEQVQARFGHRLGREAQAIARALIVGRDRHTPPRQV